MTRRRGYSASYSSPGRSSLTTRRFDDSIHQLTAASIEESLSEIEAALRKRFGSKAEVKRTKSGTKKVAETEGQ